MHPGLRFLEETPILFSPGNISISQVPDLREKCGIILESGRQSWNSCSGPYKPWDLLYVLQASVLKIHHKYSIKGSFCILIHI
ncbi:unnamed protein product, partial [Gulo gulo]